MTRLLICALLLGCTTGAPAVSKPVEAGFPVTITDDAHRTITIERRPTRILSLAPSNTEWVFALGASDRLVGRTSDCDAPAGAASIRSIGGLFPPDYERILLTRPDLVLMIEGAVDVRQRLERRGIPVLVLQPASLDDTFALVRTLGQVLGTQTEAEGLVTTLRAGVERVLATVPSTRPTVFYEVWPDPLSTAGPRTYLHDLIRLAGGRNIVKDPDATWPRYPLERLIAADPEVIVTAHQATADTLRAGGRPAWRRLRAVRTDRVHVVPQADLLARPGPRLVEGLAWLVGAIHP